MMTMLSSLAALEKRVKEGTWFSVINKVGLMVNLHVSYEKIRKNQGISGADHVTIESFGKQVRWHNAFFADHRLFCLVKVRKSACQPCHR